MTKKKIFILIFIIVILLVLLFVFWQTISRIFKKTEHLNYKNVTYYSVSSNEYSFEVRDNAGIEKITNFLNSLSLIKEEKLHEYEYCDPIKKDEVFYIWTHVNTDDAISFCREYVSVNIVTEKGSEIDTDYYVVNSGYNSKDGSSKMLNFLEELIAEYAKE